VQNALERDPEDAVVMKRRREEHVEMDITPLIDITFLLLIFFVITAKVAEDNSVPLPPADYGATVTKGEAVVISVVNSDGLPKVYKGEGTKEENRILASAAPDQEEEIAKYVQDEIAQSPHLTSVLIHADKALPSREVNRIARAACRMGNVKLFYKVQED
jgi:biopolymer transport protein ExbD